jgi:hypothetical protein
MRAAENSNCETNRVIGGRAPSEYVKTVTRKSGADDARVHEILKAQSSSQRRFARITSSAPSKRDGMGSCSEAAKLWASSSSLRSPRGAGVR